jgi:hypothetical protein
VTEVTQDAGERVEEGQLAALDDRPILDRLELGAERAATIQAA